MKREKTSTTTETRTEVSRRDLGKAFRKADLTVEEEQVLRMRAGLPLPGGAPLAFRGQTSAELATKLAMIEHEALGRVRARPASAPLEGRALKSAIIDELKKI